jgi:hypothetical protein
MLVCEIIQHICCGENIFKISKKCVQKQAIQLQNGITTAFKPMKKPRWKAILVRFS